MLYSRAACTAPSTISPGALSPPIASRATRTVALMPYAPFYTVLHPLLGPRFSDGGSDQFDQLIQVKRLVDDVNHARGPKLFLFVFGTQECSHHDHRNWVFDGGHFQQLQLVASIEIRHHQ